MARITHASRSLLHVVTAPIVVNQNVGALTAADALGIDLVLRAGERWAMHAALLCTGPAASTQITVGVDTFAAPGTLGAADGGS